MLHSSLTFSLSPHLYSRKFWRKVHFIPTLQVLTTHIAIDDDLIAAPVLAADQAIMAKHPAWKRYQPEEEAAAAGGKKEGEQEQKKEGSE